MKNRLLVFFSSKFFKQCFAEKTAGQGVG